MTNSLKHLISSPLEAGPSILDANQLPCHLKPALEYASARLAKKSIHLTLVVVRRDYQLPPSVLTSPNGLKMDFPSPTPTTPGSPPLSASSSSRFTRHLSRWTSRHVSPDSPMSTISTPTFTPRSATFPMTARSPTFSPRSATFPMARSQWPSTPGMPMSPPPMTPGTATSSMAPDYGLSLYAGGFGMRLIHSGNLPPKAEKTMHHTLIKTARKFGIGSNWLAPPIKATGLTNRLVNSSVAQNHVLFSSEGLTLVSLDRLYSLKCALSSYSRTHSPLRLEDAVDDLRRCILADGCRKISRSELLRSYDWMHVSTMAMMDLDRMYRTAYGGPEELSGLCNMPQISQPVVVSEPEIRKSEDTDKTVFDENIDIAMIGIAISESPELELELELKPKPKPERTPSPKAPILRIKTSFEKPPKLATIDIDCGGDVTARPDEKIPEFPSHQWHVGSTIDQVLSTGENNIMSPLPHGSANDPMTPNGYDDISPITRGEWGFLMGDHESQGARKVAVETC